MRLKFLKTPFSVAKLRDLSRVDLSAAFYFLSRTEDEISLVCPSDAMPPGAVRVEPGWRAFKVDGTLDFGLVGILARLTGLLAEKGVPVFAVSTFDTDYLLIKEDRAEEAREALTAGGCEVF